jgi:tRNA-specific 2-thiouridylase
MTRSRVAVAMSGGVDSSAAAAILREQGYDVVGFSMQLWDQRRNGRGEERRPGGCCALDDLYDARQVAARLAIPHYVVNFEREFEQVVVKSFVEDYRHGLTPSPCVLCNSRMKFDRLLRLARDVQASHVATGHYARTIGDGQTGRQLLLKGVDADKDQSYFLFELSQEQLASAMFPLGGLNKDEVRRIAHRYGLQVADKAESQEICFVADRDYARFVERYHPEEWSPPGSSAGEIIDQSGKVVGCHSGIHRYTIGQRRGLGIAHSVPLYVTDIQYREKRLIVGERPRLARGSCCAVRVNWIAVSELTTPLRVSVKIRSRHPEAPATITPLSSGAVRVDFDAPQMAVTPGQAAVFYRGEQVLGGGWIARPDHFPGGSHHAD